MENVQGSQDRNCLQAFINVQLCLNVFREMGMPFTMRDRILDFGSGDGWMVYAFRKLGYRAYGADMAPAAPRVTRLMEQEGLSQPGDSATGLIDKDKYRIPFEDDSFDVVVSWEVMEHVQDHRSALSEIKRVLKPGGRSFHVFPARYRPMEPHILVPFATMIQSRPYLLFWSLMGFGDGKGLSAWQTACKEHDFLKHQTRYLSKKEIRQLVEADFGNAEFVERHLWKYNGGKSGFIYRSLKRLGLQRAIPLATVLLSPFGRRAVFFAKPLSQAEPTSEQPNHQAVSHWAA